MDVSLDTRGGVMDALSATNQDHNQGQAKNLLRIAAALLAGHWLIHLIGFVTPWRMAALEGFTYRTTAINGALEFGDTGVRLVGLVWLGLAIGFAAAGYGVWRGKPWALGLAGVLAIVSLIVCVLGLPETFAGVAINVVILAVVAYVAILRPRRSQPSSSACPRPHRSPGSRRRRASTKWRRCATAPCRLSDPSDWPVSAQVDESPRRDHESIAILMR